MLRHQRLSGLLSEFPQKHNTGSPHRGPTKLRSLGAASIRPVPRLDIEVAHHPIAYQLPLADFQNCASGASVYKAVFYFNNKGLIKHAHSPFERCALLGTNKHCPKIRVAIHQNA